MASEIEYKTPACDEETRPFWEGCGRHELVLQRCRDCGAVQHRPRAACVSCRSDAIEYVGASGRGKVHTFTVTQQNQAPAFRTALPYVLAYVELDEGPRLLSNVVGVDDPATDVQVGQRVRVEWEQHEELKIPLFRPI